MGELADAEVTAIAQSATDETRDRVVIDAPHLTSRDGVAERLPADLATRDGVKHGKLVGRQPVLNGLPILTTAEILRLVFLWTRSYAATAGRIIASLRTQLGARLLLREVPGAKPMCNCDVNAIGTRADAHAMILLPDTDNCASAVGIRHDRCRVTLGCNPSLLTLVPSDPYAP